jgi:hypothetical protein
MVDWFNLAFNGLWVLGAAVILSAFSLAHHKARCRAERPRTQLTTPEFETRFLSGVTLISLGAALLGLHWWDRLLWGALCAISAWQVWTAWRRKT